MTVVAGFVDVHANTYLFGDWPLANRRSSAMDLYLSHGVTTFLDPSVNSEPGSGGFSGNRRSRMFGADLELV